MKANIKLGRIGGVELGLHYSWLLIAALITFSLSTHFRYTNPDWGTVTVWVSAIVTGALFFVGLFAHELAHAMVAKSRGLPIRSITLFFLGGMAQIEREAEDASTEFWMAIAGPIASVMFGAICFALARAAFGWEWGATPLTPPAAVLVWLGYINLVLAAFNLIPGFPMDGGRVLRAIVWWASGNGEKATRIAARIGQFVGWLFVIWGIFRVFTGAGFGGLWIALIGWFLVQAASATLLQARAATALRGLTVRDVMMTGCARVDAGLTVEQFVSSYLERGEKGCFLVYDGERPSGLIALSQVRKLGRELWPRTTVREIMQPIETAPRVAPDVPAQQALERMAGEDLGTMLVSDRGYLAGVLTRGHLLRVLRIRSELHAA